MLLQADGTSFPFPVDAPFKMRPGLNRLHVNDHLFQYVNGKHFDAYQQAKRDVNRNVILGKRAREAEDLLFEFWNNANLWGMAPLGSSAKSFLSLVRHSLVEDFAVLLPDENGNLVAEILDVQFPSGWNPEEKINQSFSALHRPVVDARFLKDQEPFSMLLRTDGPFRRYVWTLATSPALAAVPNVFPVRSLSDIWFRVETQTTIPLPAGSGTLFLIYVQTVNLERDIPPHFIEQIHSALGTMTSDVLAYKNQRGFLDFFAEWDLQKVS